MDQLTKEEYENLTPMQQAQHNQQVALNVLGGFGCRVHLGDIEYAKNVNDLQNKVAEINARDIECMICIIKKRSYLGEEPKDDKFDVIGGTMGVEVELTALHAIVGSQLQIIRANIEEKNGAERGTSDRRKS